MSRRSRKTRRIRRGFTLVELLVAGMAGFLVIGSVTIALFQSTRARNATRTRLTAFSRANAALDIIRKDVASVMRRSDLFETRVFLLSDAALTPDGEFERDELLLFNNSLRPTRPNEYSGEGQEYESQFRVGEDETGVAIWQRRDSVPDQWSDAGGMATPVVKGIVGLQIEAYDGESWFDDWDSDIDGMPWALRITVTANGSESGEQTYRDSDYFAVLRTQIAIDRIIPPPPPPPIEDELLEGEAGGEGEALDGGEDAAGGLAPIGGGGRPGSQGGGRPGSEGGGGRPGSGGRPSGGGRPGSSSGGGGRPGGGPIGGTGTGGPR